MKFERGLYSESWHVLRSTYILFLIVVLGSYVIDASNPLFKSQLGDIGSAVSLLFYFVLWAVLSYAAHTKTLLPIDNRQGVRPLKVLGFTLRFALVTFLVLNVGQLLIAIGLIVFSGFSWERFFIILENYDPSQLSDRLAFYPAFASALILFGTILPAYIVGSGRGVFAAFFRGVRQFLWSFAQLIIGPVVVSACLDGFNDTATVATGWLQKSGAGSSLIQGADIAMDLTRRLTFAYVTILVAIVLSRAFLRDRAASVVAGPTPEQADITPSA